MMGALLFNGYLKKETIPANVMALALAKHAWEHESGNTHAVGTSVTISPNDAECSHDELKVAVHQLTAISMPFIRKNGATGYARPVKSARITSQGNAVILLHKDLIIPPCGIPFSQFLKPSKTNQTA